MKKYIFAIAAAVMMLAASCDKESANAPETLREPNEGEFLAVIDEGAVPQNAPGRISDGMTTKTVIKSDGNVFWKTNDEISVNGVSYTCDVDVQQNKAIFSTAGGETVSSPFHAFYGPVTQDPESFATGTLLANRTYNSDNNASDLPMYAHSVDNKLTFSNICGVLRIIVPLATANKIVVTTDEPNNGAFTLVPQTDNTSHYQAVITATTASEGNNVITVTNNNGNFINGDTVYIAMPAKTYHGLNIQFFAGENTTSEWETGASTKTEGYTVVANKVHNINFFGIIKQRGLLPGKFKVSDSKYVYFTTGNLYCDPSNSKALHFEESQEAHYAYSSTDIPSASYEWTTHISHFRYRDNLDSAMYSTGSGKKTTGSGQFNNTAYLFCGVGHTITVDGVVGCYDLSYNDWTYFWNNNAYTNKQIDNIYYFIVAPTGGSIPENATTIAGYTEAGCVCLAVQGYLDKNNSLIFKNGSRYVCGDNRDESDQFRYFQFTNAKPTLGGSKKAYDIGRSIRLVKDITTPQ